MVFNYQFSEMFETESTIEDICSSVLKKGLSHVHRRDPIVNILFKVAVLLEYNFGLEKPSN